MLLKKWENLPPAMQNELVRKYYEILVRKKCSLFWKRVLDIVLSCILLVLLSPVFLVLAVAIKADSKGGVFFRQERVTQYGKVFRIFKFRTMVSDAESLGASVTSDGDSRITRVGAAIRKCRLDEIAQLLNILSGDMSFVGTRPEVVKYVDHYTEEMMATLLLPAGVTSMASILYKDEDRLISSSDNADETYINIVMPEKMRYNLQSIEKYSFWDDVKTMFKTVFAVLK